MLSYFGHRLTGACHSGLRRVVSGFAKIGVSVLVAGYLARGFANGDFVPSSIAYIVDGVRGLMEGIFS